MKIGLVLVFIFPFLAAGWLAGVPVDSALAQPAPMPTPLPPLPTPTPCEQSMIGAVEENGWGIPIYTGAGVQGRTSAPEMGEVGDFGDVSHPQNPPNSSFLSAGGTEGAGFRPLSVPNDTGEGGAWSLTGVAGSLREWQWDTSRGGPVFDLVQVYYRHEMMRYPLWAAVGVTMPPYYIVHDAASHQAYVQQGHGDQPYYVSFVAGAATRPEVLAMFSQPGKHRITLQVEGSFVSAEGIDWQRCEPGGSEYCILARFFESLSPPVDDLPFPGESNRLIHTGSASSHPLYGFLIWPVHAAQTLNLCPALGLERVEHPFRKGTIYAN